MTRNYLSWIDDEKLLAIVDEISSKFIKGLEESRQEQDLLNREGIVDVLDKAFLGKISDFQDSGHRTRISFLAGDLHRQIVASFTGWRRARRRGEHPADVYGDETFAQFVFGKSVWPIGMLDDRLKNISDFLTRFNSASYILVFVDAVEVPDYIKRENPLAKLHFMTGTEFYSYITKVPNAKEQLYAILPQLIKEYLPGFVFLSYSRTNTDKMLTVRDALRSIGVKVWTDENLIPGTAEWEREIANNIRECSGLIVLLSPRAEQSEWVNNEIRKAKTHEKRIFPVLLEGDEATSVPMSINGVQRIDATKSMENAIAQLTNAVTNHLRDQRGKPTNPP